MVALAIAGWVAHSATCLALLARYVRRHEGDAS
jgi:hypothetical protein